MPVQTIEGIDITTLSLAGVGDGQREAHVIEALKQRYGYIIIVAPPLREDISALNLAQSVDFVAPVVVSEKTRKPALTSLLRDLDQMGANLLGMVMLERRSHIPKAIYRLVA